MPEKSFSGWVYGKVPPPQLVASTAGKDRLDVAWCENREGINEVVEEQNGVGN